MSKQTTRHRIAEVNGIRLNEAVGGIDTEDQARKAGIELAHKCQWDGYLILVAAGEALEDANFHSEAAAVRAMADKVNG